MNPPGKIAAPPPAACNNYKAGWRGKTLCQTCNLDKKMHPNADGDSKPAKEGAPEPAPKLGVRMLPVEPGRVPGETNQQSKPASSPRTSGHVAGVGSGILRNARVEKEAKDPKDGDSNNGSNNEKTDKKKEKKDSAPQPTVPPPTASSAPPATQAPQSPGSTSLGGKRALPPPGRHSLATAPLGSSDSVLIKRPPPPSGRGGPPPSQRPPSTSIPTTPTPAATTNTTTTTTTNATTNPISASAPTPSVTVPEPSAPADGAAPAAGGEVIPIPPKPSANAHRQTPGHSSGSHSLSSSMISRKSISPSGKLASPKSPAGKPGHPANWRPVEVSLLRMRSATDPHAMKMTTCGRALNNLLSAMGLSDNSIHDIEQRVSKADVAKDTGPISMYAQSHLEDIIISLQNYLRLQQELRCVIKGQAFIRRHQAIKLYRKYRAVYIDTSLKKRNEAFRDLVKREEVYVQKLNVVVKKYLEPLREQVEQKKSKSLVSAQDIAAVFSNSQTLLTVHEEMQKQLHNVQNKWPEIDGLADIFLTMAPFFRAYGEYVDNFKNAIDTYLELSKKDKFEAYMDEIYEATQKETEHANLHGLLAMPLNHISSYEQAILAFIENTPSTHPDYSPLGHCYSIISGTSRFIQEAIQYGDNRKLLLGLQDKLGLTGKDKWGLLADNIKRTFAGEAPCLILSDTTKKATKEKGALFLFSDVAILTTVAKSVYKIVDRLDVDQLHLDDIPNSAEFQHNAIKLTQPGMAGNASRSYILGFKEDKDKWVNEIKKILGTFEQNKVYGVPLRKLCEHDSSRAIPHVVEKFIKYLDQPKFMDTEGLFRVSGVLVNVQFVKESFDKAGVGKDPDINWAACSVHDISSALKLFFRELPEPLLTWSLYEPLGAIGGKDSSTPTYISELRDVLRGLPPPNKKVLLYLLRYLARLAENSEKTKMTPANLAIVFAPTLCSPKNDTIEYVLGIGRINAVVEQMIKHSEELGLA
eukprot:TRINITY_DN1475_c0_g2_i1.p1 TRINITY_DN1475_c0_g2~~TRINITY_DN1475_c0_g2_i1.p1  ORF type:complete len:979 (+),score=172.77 TRINITY_DN1475_c0_g2_i1:251-3187(+)